MKRIVILGAGTAGTIVANKLTQELDLDQWKITVVDQSEIHYYQPGFLFIPFGIYSKEDVVRPRRDYLPRGVEFIISEIDVIEPDKNRVKLKKDGRVLPYDFLIDHHRLAHRAGGDPWPDRARLAAQASSTSTPSTAPTPCTSICALGGRPARAQRRRDADQVPGGTAGVPLPGRLVLPRARACATRSS